MHPIYHHHKVWSEFPGNELQCTTSTGNKFARTEPYFISCSVTLTADILLISWVTSLVILLPSRIRHGILWGGSTILSLTISISGTKWERERLKQINRWLTCSLVISLSMSFGIFWTDGRFGVERVASSSSVDTVPYKQFGISSTIVAANGRNTSSRRMCHSFYHLDQAALLPHPSSTTKALHCLQIHVVKKEAYILKDNFILLDCCLCI